MWSYHLLNYKITFDPAYGLEFIDHMWRNEPVGSFSICLTLTGLLLTLCFKLLDYWWDLRKERARQGKLRIELGIEQSRNNLSELKVVLANTGKEPIVVRELGFLRKRWLGTEFIPVSPAQDVLPYALNAQALVEVVIPVSPEEASAWLSGFRVRDSLGKLWEAPDREIRKARQSLRHLRRAFKNPSEPILNTRAESPSAS